MFEIIFFDIETKVQSAVKVQGFNVLCIWHIFIQAVTYGQTFSGKHKEIKIKSAFLIQKIYKKVAYHQREGKEKKKS
jgi:hypothetical protein